MIRAILRSFAVAACVIGIAGVSRFVEFMAFCDEKHAADRVRAAGGEPDKLPVDGFAIARPTDEIVVCRSQHCLGPQILPLLCHEDIGCYCIAGNPDKATIEGHLRGGRRDPIDCRVDKRNPRPDDETGVCPHAHCLGHLDFP